MESIEEEQDVVLVNGQNQTTPTVLNETSYEFELNDYVSGEEDVATDDDNDDGPLLGNTLQSGFCEESLVVDPIIMNGLVDIVNINMRCITGEEVDRYYFGDLEAAYLFYYWYARINGFFVRKSKVVKSCKGEKIQQTFLCSREGHREDRGLTAETRKREPRNDTRCDCHAKFVVHVTKNSGLWQVKEFTDEHSHELLEEDYCSLLPSHRKMTVGDILQIENLRKAGIRPPQIFGSLASISGGYDKIGFRKKDLHNHIARERRHEYSDATGALKFLHDLKKTDPMMFVTHTVDNEGRLQHLFWCDGESQLNYEVFGDVIGFDATYRKNKYLCPFVIFSGVNNHNQTIIFATALVCDETQETYVWLLQQFLEAMKGKAPVSVITDGHLAMKNAIKIVFPGAHHRLCAWHLIRNANSNVHIPAFMKSFKKCMLGDYEVGKFETMWVEMVNEFGLHEKKWIKDLYEKKQMWATSHIRGKFFAGIRTTSRCEGFHSHLGKFVSSKIGLSEFVEQFQRCLTYFRYREFEADLDSDYGDVVLQTSLHKLERSAAKQFTKEIFLLIRPILSRAPTLMRIRDCHQTPMFQIFSVSKYCDSGTLFHVCFCPSTVEFTCSCLRMESFGLPCDHIVTILVHLDIVQFPKSLVLNRWSKSARKCIRERFKDGSINWDSNLIARHAQLHFIFREIAQLSYRDKDDYNHIVNVLAEELSKLRLKHASNEVADNVDSEIVNVTVHNPVVVRTKGCGPNAHTSAGRTRRNNKCRNCGGYGHNKRSCVVGRQNTQSSQALGLDDGNGDMEMETLIGSTSFPATEHAKMTSLS